MNYLPLFVDTSGKKCLVVGGGNVASRKLIPILKSDMDVNLVAPEINKDICELAKNYKNLILEKRKFEKKDIDNSFPGKLLDRIKMNFNKFVNWLDK